MLLYKLSKNIKMMMLISLRTPSPPRLKGWGGWLSEHSGVGEEGNASWTISRVNVCTSPHGSALWTYDLIFLI